MHQKDSSVVTWINKEGHFQNMRKRNIKIKLPGTDGDTQDYGKVAKHAVSSFGIAVIFILYQYLYLYLE